MVPLKYLIRFWRALKIPSINCEINLILTWSASCVRSNTAANQAKTFAITDRKLYVAVLSLSTDDNAKLLQQLKAEFKRIINWNKYEPKATTQNASNQYFDFLIE